MDWVGSIFRKQATRAAKEGAECRFQVISCHTSFRIYVTWSTGSINFMIMGIGLKRRMKSISKHSEIYSLLALLVTLAVLTAINLLFNMRGN
jgi:predicted permease